MKTNIRLFVPNTTEALDFEYGLLIHYMKYNEYRSQAEIGLKYYELADIDPINNALDIVQQQVITDTNRGQSKIDGFTLDSHYTLSFNQRLNNKIEENSARQIWLWLNCNNPKEYHFLLEKITDTEQKIVSDQNQLFVRLWRHPEWMEHDIDPFDQGKIGSLLELISVVKQRLEAQFDQIEQENREKVLTDLKLREVKLANIEEKNSILEIEKNSYPLNDIPMLQSENSIKRLPVYIDMDDLKVLQQAFIEWRAYSNTKKLINCLSESFLQKIGALDYEVVFAKAGIGLNKMIIDRKPPNNTCMIGLSKPHHSLMFCYDKTSQTDDRWRPNTWYEVSIDPPDSAYEQVVNQLEELGSNDEYQPELLDRLDEQRVHEPEYLDLEPLRNEVSSQEKNDNEENKIVSTSGSSKPEVPIHIALQNETLAPIEQPKKSTWWIWPLIIFIGFLFNPVAGGVLIALAICWYILKFIFSSPILCLILVIIIIIGFLSAT